MRLYVSGFVLVVAMLVSACGVPGLFAGAIDGGDAVPTAGPTNDMHGQDQKTTDEKASDSETVIAEKMPRDEPAVNPAVETAESSEADSSASLAVETESQEIAGDEMPNAQ